jgi:hypothetical protein
MNGPFAVGEIVIFKDQSVTDGFSFIANGDEVEIIEAAAMRPYPCGHTHFSYVVAYRQWQVVVEAKYLHRKRPPATFTGEQRIRELFTPAPAKELEPA